MVGNVDAVHALYYLTIFPWVHIFGTSELALRFPSALAMTAASFVGVLLACRLAHSTFKNSQLVHRATSFAALLIAIQPSISMYGQEARGYAFGILMALLATYMFLSFLDGQRFALPLYAIYLTLAAGYSLYTIFLIPVFFLFSLANRIPWSRLISFVLASCFIMLLITPLLLLGKSQQGQVSWIDNTLDVLLRRMYSQFFFSPASHFGHWGLIGKTWAPYIATIAVLLTMWGLFSTHFNKIFFFLLATILFPMSCIVVSQFLGFQLYTERYFAYLAPFVAIILAFSLASISWQAARYVMFVVLAASFIPASLGQSDFNAKVDHQYKTAAQFALSRKVDQVIFIEAVDRSLSYAVKPTTNYEDVLLDKTPEDSGTLFGVNKPVFPAIQEHKYSGSVVVTTVWGKGYYNRVVTYLIEQNCIVQDRRNGQHFSTTLLSCPDS